MNERSDKDPKSIPKFGQYIVSFLDVLGQGKKLRQLRGRPTEAKRDELIETAKQVVFLRRDFRESLSGISPTLKHLRSQSGGIDLQDDRESRIRITTFSDAMTASVSLIGSGDQAMPALNLWSVLFATCGTVVLSMARGYAVRGGVELGLCLPLPETDEIYGAALERAYALEAHVAQSPRVVLGPELLQYLRDLMGQPRASVAEKVSAGAADLCMRLVCEDSDGNYVLDFLGDFFREKAADAVEEVLPEVRSFIREQYDRFEHDPKLEPRYRSLRQYAVSRIGSLDQL